jgi:hypothetical protein
MKIKPNIFEQFDKLYAANENSYAFVSEFSDIQFAKVLFPLVYEEMMELSISHKISVNVEFNHDNHEFREINIQVWNNKLKLDEQIDDYILFLRIMKTFAFLVEEKLMSDKQNNVRSTDVMMSALRFIVKQFKLFVEL